MDSGVRRSDKNSVKNLENPRKYPHKPYRQKLNCLSIKRVTLSLLVTLHVSNDFHIFGSRTL